MNLKKLLFLAVSASLVFSADAARVNKFGVDTKVCDPVLIYTGGMTKRLAWDKQNLKHLVVHEYADGHKDWFYDAFIFNETVWSNGYYYLFNNVGVNPATKNVWTWYLDWIFRDNFDISAIDNIITEMKAELGNPPLKHKIIIGLCVPCMDHSYRSPDGGDAGFQWTKYNWGQIDGVDMDFSKKEHRLKAVKWFIDEAIKRFKAKGYKNLELAGFYSVEESMNPRVSNGDMQKYYNDYIHELGYHAYWIPYYPDNDKYADYWKDTYNFDMAYRQPNYFFYNPDGSLPSDYQLTYAINNSKLYGLGLELEFETSETSNGLHEVSPAMHQRLVDYIDYYEKSGVWDESGVAHYGGTQGFVDMANSTDPVNHATMDRLAKIVKKRQLKFAIDNPSAAVTDVVADEPVEQFAFTDTGLIYIPAKFENARVYGLSGEELFVGGGYFHCAKGIYIVTDGCGHTVKVAVK